MGSDDPVIADGFVWCAALCQNPLREVIHSAGKRRSVAQKVGAGGTATGAGSTFPAVSLAGSGNDPADFHQLGTDLELRGVGAVGVDLLSLIHISEPTRPY